MSIIDKVFHYCVSIFRVACKVTGTTYKFVNVIIFCVLIPVAFIILLFAYYNAKTDAARYKKLYEKFVQDDLEELLIY